MEAENDLDDFLRTMCANSSFVNASISGHSKGIDVLLAKEIGHVHEKPDEKDANTPTLCLKTFKDELRLHQTMRSESDGCLIKAFGHSPGVSVTNDSVLTVSLAANTHCLCISVAVCPLFKGGELATVTDELSLYKEVAGNPTGERVVEDMQDFVFPRGQSHRVIPEIGPTCRQYDLRVPINVLKRHRLLNSPERLFVVCHRKFVCVGLSEPLSITKDVYLPFYKP